MSSRSPKILAILVLFVASTACSITDAKKTSNQGAAQATPVAPVATPAKNLTEADVSRLKWIEGTWRGMDGEKPFFERYRIENDTALVVESFADETLTKIEDTSRFELQDGEFGKTDGDRRSAASVITSDMIQFVPVGAGNSFRFERQPGGTWRAVLDWAAKDTKPARQKIYQMEPWPKVKQ